LIKQQDVSLMHSYRQKTVRVCWPTQERREPGIVSTLRSITQKTRSSV